MITLAGIYWIPGIPTLASAISEAASSADLAWEHLNSTGAIIIVFGIVFLVGNIIEVIAYVFLNTLFSLFGGKMAYQGVQAYVQGVFSGKQDAPSLSETEQATFEKLPDFVQIGLGNPYHRQFEVAFRYLIHVAPDDEKPWLQQLDSRNKNLFSVISSAFLAMMLLAFLFFGVDFAAARAFGQELSQSQKICYNDLVGAFRRLDIVGSNQAGVYYQRIARGDFLIIEEFEKILQSPGYNETMQQIREGTQIDDSNDPTVVFGRCVGTGPAAQDSFLVRLGYFFVGLIVFALVLSSLAVTYALMLRNSISSALEMLQIRQVIASGGAEAGGPPSP